ncbi:hypothetical protein EDB87DRAFT_1588959, partial [Lactarius vividus]
MCLQCWALAGSPLVARVAWEMFPWDCSLLISRCAPPRRVCTSSVMVAPPIGTLQEDSLCALHVLCNPSCARFVLPCPSLRAPPLRANSDLDPGAPSHEPGTFGDGTK